ncbi:MAG: 3-oxoacyl-ACP synthase [Clostridia bacterium]|nr:3-oxoacyl-ACP synthase [Clostridia bacterium]MBQ3496051.1 3-oxoacyl-ACP synthase [Clostridia bacterium]MBQ4586511.1 3-oxoacyl-ACP synthase [Clostridia bacterium]MBQ6883527.1 3-oxoacyl-ACP synthase [Clostridia bacterium]MBR2933081.1 3-oxoacyl-ACP synthase [Clostridia bacterium]
MKPTVGIVGVGTYLPKNIMTAAQISAATNGVWSEDAVRNKLGINQKYMPSNEPCDGTQEMGALAALECLKNTGVDPLEIDAILCITEEWKEYPLTTSACYVQDRIGAKNAWGIDVQNRCCTCVSAMKLAKDMLIADDEINMVLVCGGYRNCDFIDYTDSNVSFMFNLGAGGGAILLKKNHDKNLLLGTHLMSDGSVVHTCGSKVGGIFEPVTAENYKEYGMLRLMDSPKMKGLLNTVSMPNWYHCIDEALRKSDMTRENIDYLSILHIKKSGHLAMLKDLGLREDQAIYLSDYGHIGQIDQILSLELALKEGKVKDGSVVCMIAAGIGYTWAANVIRWG